MIYLFFILFIIFAVYSPWFSEVKTLSSGDWSYLYKENIDSFKFPTELPFLWLDPYYQITAKLGVSVFSLSWEITEKIFWFFPFLAISLISSYFFLKFLSKQLEIDGEKSTIFIALGCLIFTTNTYILMLVGGGQMGVVMAYSLMPIATFILFKIIQNPASPTGGSGFRIQDLLIGSLILGIQLMFDPRIFSLTVLTAFLYILFKLKDLNFKILKRLTMVLIPTVIFNLFWILPNLGYLNMAYESAIGAADASFLSFATFSNSISLLHPNWPENIFGKVGFMKSEFIILPILAYVSLLLISKIRYKKTGNNLAIKQLNNKTILFFALLGLTGAFFAKGVNPPFGEIYSVLSNLPGFGAFRDPTKFYTMVVVSYMVLMPFSLYKLSEKISTINYKTLSIIFVAFWLVLIHPALFGNLSGTFKPHVVPGEYIKLKDFLNSQPKFSKTLWVPKVERFGFSSNNHPALSSLDVFKESSLSGVLKDFKSPDAYARLKDLDIKYAIVPYDALSEIFINDRKYDESLYVETVNTLIKIEWLDFLANNDFGKIKIFKLNY